MAMSKNDLTRLTRESIKKRSFFQDSNDAYLRVTKTIKEETERQSQPKHQEKQEG